jgi:hypothetical protein
VVLACWDYPASEADWQSRPHFVDGQIELWHNPLNIIIPNTGKAVKRTSRFAELSESLWNVVEAGQPRKLKIISEPQAEIR